MTQYSKLRLEIAEYFDSVIRDVDLIVETKIARDAEFEVVLNERRQQQIVGIQQLMQAGLAKVESIRKESGPGVSTMNQLVDEFCFVVEFAELPFVIKTNRFIEASEIEQFKTFMKWQTLSHQERLDALIGRPDIFSCDGVEVESIKKEVRERFLNADVLFLDFSSWFAKGQELAHVMIDGIYPEEEAWMDGIIKNIKSPFNVKTVELDCADGFLQSKTLIQLFCSIFEGAQQIIVSLAYCSLPNLRRIERIKAIDHRIELKAGCEFYFDDVTDDELSEDELRLRQDVYSLSFSAPKPKLHPKAWMDGFVNLRKLTINSIGDSSRDLSVLDPVRDRLSDLSVDGLITISYKMFSGMRSLKDLSIHFVSLVIVELDENGQLFADLTQLESLSLDLNMFILTSGCLIELPVLKKLNLNIHRSYELFDASRINLRFNLPELSEFRIRQYGELSSTVASRIIRLLPSVETLDLSTPTKEEISSAVTSMKKLSKLILYHLNHDALKHPTNLEELRLIDRGKTANKVNIDNLVNLKRIYYDYQDSESIIKREHFVLSALNKLVYRVYYFE